MKRVRHDIAKIVIRNRERRLANPEKYKASYSAYNASDATYGRHLKRKYGITFDDYLRMLSEQGGACAICGTTKPSNGRIKRWAVDHNHETKKVRALLCHCCNHGIGSFKENIQFLDAAKRYLISHW